MKKKIFMIIAVVLVTALGLSACSSQKSEKKETDIQGKRLVYGSNDYTSINPALYEHGEINSLIFSGLTAHNEKNEVVPDLAEKWEFDRKTNTYTFYLRKNVKFQDGEPFRAEDVKFTLETIMNPENQSEIASNYEDIKNIKVIDDTTIQIELTAPNIAMLDYLTIGILPKHLLEGKDIATDEWNQKPIGTGPYTIVSWDKGQSIRLVKNTNCYKTEPKIDEVIFKIVEDSSAKALQLKSGELDLAQVTPKDAVQFEGEDTYFTNLMKTADYRGIMYNFNHDFFRQNRGIVGALSYAIDRQAIVDAVLLGHGEAAYSPLQRSVYHNPDMEKFLYDPEKAQEELEKLGWKKGASGIYEKDGKPLEFTINCMEGDQVRVDMASICAQQFKQIGVNVSVKVNAETDWNSQDAFLIGWGSPFDPDDHTYKVFGTDKGSNYNAYSNAKVDELLKKARETENIKERKQLYGEFQNELAKDLPYTFLAYIDAIYVGKKQITGMSTDTVLGHHGVGIFWNIAEWDIVQ